LKKTKEFGFHRPHQTKWHVHHSLEGTEQVHTAKLVGVMFQNDFKFVDHVDATLKLCSQRVFLLKQLRDQGMTHGHLYTLFQAIVLNRIAHAFPAWGPFLNIALSQRINGFLKRSYRCGFTNHVFEVKELLNSVS